MSGPQGGGRIYGQHGERHQPWGSDPGIPDDWVYIGEDPRVPFITGFNMAPTAEIPNPVPMGFRFALGRPNDCEWDGWEGSGPTGDRPVATAILEYRPHMLEIAGDVDGVAVGDIVFVLPLEYRHPNDRPVHTHDHFGNYVPCRLLSTGEYLYGVP